MATREAVLQLVRSGGSMEAAARRLGIPAGRACMIATGIPTASAEAEGGR